jgi:hypothetical protein
MDKGDRLLCRMQNPALLNDQSTVTSLDMLATSGWTRHIEVVGPEVFLTLESFFLQEGVYSNQDDFQAVRWEHTEISTNSQGQQVPVCYAT